MAKGEKQYDLGQNLCKGCGVNLRAVCVAVHDADGDVVPLHLCADLVGEALEHAALLLHAAFKGADDGGPERFIGEVDRLAEGKVVNQLVV